VVVRERKKVKKNSSFFIKRPSKRLERREGLFILLALLFLSGVVIAEELDKGEVFPGSFLYATKKNETLYSISRKFNMCPELLKEINDISEGEKLPNRLKIVSANFSIVIEREKNILTLYRDGKFFKEYSVASGRDFSTPLGEYWIMSKLISPPWVSNGKVIETSDLDYPLGTRWMGLSDTRIGIHGTKDPQYIGQYVSSGCIRMHNNDVEELFKIVPFGTKVTIKE